MNQFVDLLRNHPAALKKFFVAVVSALAVAAAEGFVDQSAVSVIVAFAGAFGVYAVPNDDSV